MSTPKGYNDFERLEITRDGNPLTDAEYQLAVDRYQVAVARMHRSHTRTEITGGLIWLLAGTGAALLCFRVFPPPARLPRAATLG